MARSAHRLGDFCNGHCFNARPNQSGSPNVFINGIPSHRVGDTWPPHCCGPVCHGSVTVGGSSNVFVNGRPKVRQGDPLDCGDTTSVGSPNVFVGG